MSAAATLLAAHGPEDRWLTESPYRTYFESKNTKTENKKSESYEIPFDQSAVYYGESALCTVPSKGEITKRFTVRSTLPALYVPLGPGYVYPLYTDQVDGSIYIPDGTLAIQPGDFVGYFNSQFQAAWSTNFVGYANINVTYNSSTFKFVFTSTVYSYIYFQNDASGVFWGFDPRAFDLLTPGGYKAYKFTNGVLNPSFTLFQAGWIRGYTPPPTTGFSYVDSVACKLIKSATLLIGGQTIDRLTSERLIIEDDLGVSYENQTGLAIMEGKGDTSQVYAPREYYTRLTFNNDKINLNALQHQDVRLEIEYEKFENLPSNLITTNSLTDGNSYLNTNIKTLLGIPNNTRVYSTSFYKKWIVYGMENPNNGYFTRYYFYDTTKPIGSASSWTYWDDPEFHQLYPGRPYFVGGTMYLYTLGITYIRSVPFADAITGTASVTVGSPIFPNLYENKIEFVAVQADARYVYLWTNVKNLTFGSNTATVFTYLPGNGGTGLVYLNVDYGKQMNLVYNVASISTTQLIASDNVALTNFVTTSCLGITPQYTPTSVTITNQTKILSNIVATVNVLYTNDSLPVYNLPGFYTTTSVPLTGSNVATFISCTPEVAFSNISVVLKVYNITTPQLIPTENTAVINWVTSVTPDFGQTKTATIVSEIKTLSNIFVTANVAYTYTSNGKPYFFVTELPIGYVGRNYITVRYDTTKPIGSWSSYDYLTYPGTSAPKTWNEITGLFSYSIIDMAPIFDGRNLYTTIPGTNFLLKTDTQNFLDISGYTYFNVSTLGPTAPVLIGTGGTKIPNATDGRYVYFITNEFLNGSGYLTRYDSTQSISSPSAYSAILYTNPLIPDHATLFPFGFDGKTIYYLCGLIIVRYDTTTNSVSDWIIFDGVGGAQTSNGPIKTISWVSKNYLNNQPAVAITSCLVSARYVYITETWGGSFETFNDLVQFDPLVMTGTLTSSIIAKYETYDTPKPTRIQNFYGQTTVNEFTLLRGRTSDSFKLDVRGPVREFWITIDSPGVINRVVFKLNNEIIVDDDQAMTRYIRTFETHTSMPSSSNTCVYSVALDPENLTPSGTVNMSRIRDQTIDVTLVSPAPSNLKLRVYSKTFNVLAIQGGIGGLIFNS